MDYFFHQIQRKTRKPAENSVEWRFFIIPRGSFRPWFPLRMERSVESHENIQSFREIGAGWWFPSIPPFDLPAFWTVQEITRPSRNHRFSGIDQKPRTRVTEFLSKFLSKMEIPCFSLKNLFRGVANTAARWADRENHEISSKCIEKTSIWPR